MARPCAKKSYNTYEQAVARAVTSLEYGDVEGGFLRAYECRECGKFHLTKRGGEYQEQFPGFESVEKEGG